MHILAKINWDWMEEVGFLDALEPYLTKAFFGVQGQFIYIGWIRLFRIQEPVYMKLCMDFLATVQYRKKKGTHDRKNITFCLGGKRRELSLVDFALRT